MTTESLPHDATPGEVVERQACPDCGRPISLERSGWWTHDGMPGECWRLSLDGPADPECVR